MKRMIRANTFRKESGKLAVPGKNVFYHYIVEIDEDACICTGQITKITPYDDADYYWARFQPWGEVEYIYKGKIAEKSHIADCDPDDYELFTDYVNEEVDIVLRKLDKLNSNIEPRMIHN